MLKTLLLLMICSSCTMVGYLTKEGFHQAKVHFSAVKNEKFLKDPKVSDEMKRKVILIQEYKEFFYKYFDEKETSIYSKTTILPHKAVSYLVIASPHTEIRAKEFKFPVVGSFPYLGFYKEESAKKFSKKLERKENLVTYIRPVYAYSSLGYVEDRILSSFFYYDDLGLAELIFHELFHTVFFVKSEVDLNENLASYFGKELLYEYFKDRPELNKYMKIEKNKKRVAQRIVELIEILKGEFNKLGPFITDESADLLTKRFVAEIFRPEVELLCDNLELSPDNCMAKQEWNQASFAEFLTYEDKQDFISELRKKEGLSLKDFYSWLKVENKNFKHEKNKTFTDHLKSKVTSETLTIHRSNP